MKRYFRSILVFCGATTALILMLGTFCTDQFTAKKHHLFFATVHSEHVESNGTVCHLVGSSLSIDNPKDPKPNSGESISGLYLSKMVGSRNAFNFAEQQAFSRTNPLFDHLGLSRHKEIRNVIFRS